MSELSLYLDGRSKSQPIAKELAGVKELAGGGVKGIMSRKECRRRRIQQAGGGGGGGGLSEIRPSLGLTGRGLPAPARLGEG